VTDPGTPDTSVCPGCGVELPAMSGPVHRYLESSPACWEIFGQILGKEFSDPRYWPPHALTVDTYAVQHPGVESSQTTHSAAFHLMGLCLVVERGLDATRAAWMRQRSKALHKEMVWLTPPPHRGDVTVVDVVAAPTPEDHARLVRAWAASVWEAWKPHHVIVRAWADRVQAGNP
jgi:Family of unknown function (DUF5946)